MEIRLESRGLGFDEVLGYDFHHAQKDLQLVRPFLLLL